jgi:hypothetical protein
LLSGNSIAYSTKYNILAVAAFNDHSDKLHNTYDLKGHGSVYLFTRQNSDAPLNAQTPHNQFQYTAKLVASGYVEYQRNHFGMALKSFNGHCVIKPCLCWNTGISIHFDDRVLYVAAGRSLIDKVYAFRYTTGVSFDLEKIYLTDTAQWYENRGFANQAENPTAMITTQAGCNTGKCDETRDLNRPTFYGKNNPNAVWQLKQITQVSHFARTAKTQL